MARQRQSLLKVDKKLPPIRASLDRASELTTKLVRRFIRDELTEDLVTRLYRIGMGLEVFPRYTMTGKRVEVEAPPQVQVKALTVLLDAALPGQLSLVDDDGASLPGVVALGPRLLDDARKLVHGERYMEPVAVIPAPGNSDVLHRDMHQRPDLEYVEIDETAVANGPGQNDPDAEFPAAAVPPSTERNTAEHAALERLRLLRRGRTPTTDPDA